MIFLVEKLIRPFSLYVLFSQCRSCDNNLEDCFFQIFPHSRAYVRIIMKKTKGEIPPELHWENKTYQPRQKMQVTESSLFWQRKKLFRSALYKKCAPCVKKALCSQASAVQRNPMYTVSSFPCLFIKAILTLGAQALVHGHRHRHRHRHPKYFVVTAWLGIRYVTVCTFALFCLFWHYGSRKQCRIHNPDLEIRGRRGGGGGGWWGGEGLSSRPLDKGGGISKRPRASV